MFEVGKVRRLSEADRKALTYVLEMDRPPMQPKLVGLDEQTLEEMLVRAAELGAERALRRSTSGG